jgi:pimeloyl-ACP methyl ester carboxylesterase
MITTPAYQPYPYPVHFYRVREDIELAYMDVGEGPHTLLMIHGLGSYAPAWTRTIEGLSPHFRCIAVDLPNYGRSSIGDFPISLRWFGEVLRDLVAKLALGPVVLMGHSMGGQIAVWCQHLDLFAIEKMVLIAPAGFERFNSMARQWFRSINAAGLIRSMPDTQIQLNFDANFFDMPSDARFMVEDRLTLKASGDAYEHYTRMIPRCSLAMLSEPVWDILPEIDIPVKVIFGREDAMIPNRVLHRNTTTEEIAWAGTRRMPHARLTIVPQAGHFVHWEQAGACNRLMEAFVKT